MNEERDFISASRAATFLRQQIPFSTSKKRREEALSGQIRLSLSAGKVVAAAFNPLSAAHGQKNSRQSAWRHILVFHPAQGLIYDLIYDLTWQLREPGKSVSERHTPTVSSRAWNPQRAKDEELRLALCLSAR